MVLLDGLDQLGSVHRAHNLAWIPRTLPPYVRIVVSTLPDRHDLLDTLCALIPNADNFIEVLPLGARLSVNLVREWLHENGRDLTGRQYDVVRAALENCSLPLYTCLVYEEVCRWCSYSPPDTTVLEPTVNAIIHRLFDRIERYHGRIFVSRLVF